MEVSRRRFIQASAIAGVSGWVAQVAAPAGVLARPFVAATSRGKAAARPAAVFASSANFTPHVRTPFRVAGGAWRSGDLTLVGVEDAPAPASATGRPPAPCFSLLFDSTAMAGFAQGTYTVTHAALGSFAMFLSPVGGSGRVCQAVVNRRLS